MGSEDYMGSVSLFAGHFLPANYMYCDGTFLSIEGNEALFSLLGTYFGGDGRTNFALPDMREKDKDGQPMPFDWLKPRPCICVRGTFPPRS